MARTRGIREDFRIAARATLEETRRIAVDVAKREHARVMTTEPRPRSFQRFVDGREGVPEEALQLGGMVVYDYPRIDLVVEYAVAVLRERSPFGRPEDGHYRDEHRVHLNGTAVADARSFRPGDVVEIINRMPYARRIEVGAMRMRVPGTDHVYAQAQQIVRRTYGNLASIRFQWRGRQPALVIAEK